MPDAEGEPAGRSDPGKIGPLPLWGWLVVGGGILAFFWWQRAHSGSVTPDVAGADATGGAGGSLNDPVTMAELLQALQDFAKSNGGNSVSPAPVAPTKTGGCPPGFHPVPMGILGTNHYGCMPDHLPTGKAVVVPHAVAASFSTSHTTGGSSTAHTASSHLPAIKHPKPIAHKKTWLPSSGGPGVGLDAGTSYVTSPKPVVQNKTPDLNPLQRLWNQIVENNSFTN